MSDIQSLKNERANLALKVMIKQDKVERLTEELNKARDRIEEINKLLKISEEVGVLENGVDLFLPTLKEDD